MSRINDENVHTFVPLTLSLDVLPLLTEPVVERLNTLMKAWKASRATVRRDTFSSKGAVLFTLFDGRDEALLGGLIDQEGSACT